jgi:hypothetical protein
MKQLNFDLDGDGVVTDEEIDRVERISDVEYKQAVRDNEDKKEDQIRSMAWFALWGMLIYPILILFTSMFEVDKAAELIADIAPTYFVSIAGLVAAFFGAQAFTASSRGSSSSVSKK